MIAEEDFRQVMRNLAGGVTVVTTKLSGEYYGLTVTAFSSISLEPMLVQVALDLASRTQDAINKSNFFCANMLSEQQAEIARTFTIKGVDRFDGIKVSEDQTGAPMIDGAVASLDCRVVDKISAGDHTIFIGEALNGVVSSGLRPLIYYDGKYVNLAGEEL